MPTPGTNSNASKGDRARRRQFSSLSVADKISMPAVLEHLRRQAKAIQAIPAPVAKRKFWFA